MATTPIPIPQQQAQAVDPQQYAAYLKEVQAQQSNTTGLTSMQPQMTPHAPTQTPQRNPGQQQNQAYGPGQGGANKRQSAQNLVKSLQGGANQFAQYAQQKQQRQYEQTISRYTGAVQGINQAQSAVQQATEALKQNPQDAQARQSLLQAQGALKQNQTILNDMANDNKQHKIITKAFGIDDKNADTPERQAAMKVMQQQMGVNQSAAGITSQIPQTQQLSPQAQQQSMARQSGAVGKPATQGQLIAAQGKAVDQTLKAEKQMTDAGLQTDKMIDSLPQKGLVAEKNEDGTVKRNPDGTMAVRNLTIAELKDNPVLAEKYQENQQKIDLQVAQAKATSVRATASMMNAQSKQREIQLMSQPGAVQSWVAAVTDPKSGVTLAQVPAAARGAVISAVTQGGMKVSKPLTSDEIKRADLARNAVDNIHEAQEILGRRPDLFGPGGWGKTKMEMALAGGDPDALKYQAAISLANLPAVGIHGVRGKWAMEDLSKLDSNLYINPDAMKGVLGEIERSASEFRGSGGRESANPQPPQSGSSSSTDPLGILGK